MSETCHNGVRNVSFFWFGENERVDVNDKIVRGVEIVKANISLPMSFTPDAFPWYTSTS